MAARDNSDYDTFEVPKGFDRAESWNSLPEHGDFSGFLHYWKEYYFQFVARRDNGLIRAKSITGSSGENDLYYYDPQELPPIVFQSMRQTNEYTCDRSKIDFPINGVEIQWISTETPETMELHETRKILLRLSHSMPWFDHYLMVISGTEMKVTEDQLEFALSEGANRIEVTPINDLGRRGITSLVRMTVN